MSDTSKPLKGYIIHLESAREREPYVQALQANFFNPLTVVPASTGADWLIHPMISKRHIRHGEQVTQGMLGCAHSHIQLLHTAVKGRVHQNVATSGRSDDKNPIIIFEDDCEFMVSTGAIRQWVDQVERIALPWDILLLGANEYVDSQYILARVENGHEFPLTRVKRFWGTHAMIIQPSAAQAALRVFARAQEEGVFLPVDWMWNEAIRQEGLQVFGPLQPKSLCRQVPGLVSAITGVMRLGEI